MRLAIVNYAWDPSARSPAELLDRFPSLTGWASALRQAGCEPVVVCQRCSARADCLRDDVTYRFRPDRGQPRPGLTFAGAELVHAAASGARPDIVHVRGAFHPVLVARLRKKLPRRTAIVVQDHGDLAPSRLSPRSRVTVRRGLAAADALLVSTPAGAAAWLASGASPERIDIADVPGASATLAPIDRDAARAATGVDGTPALVWIGPLDAVADPLAVLRGFALFGGRIPTARLTMVFTGGALEDAVRREIARTAALETRVRLVGPSPPAGIAAYYSAADLFVLGSHTDAEGQAVVDAMACGAVPVVADVPSFRALTGSEHVGALWKPGQPGAFADALSRVAAKPLLSQREAARSRFERFYSWSSIAWKARAIYERAVRNRRDGVTTRQNSPRRLRTCTPRPRP